MWNKKTVAVVLPAYNEQGYIQAAVADFRSVIHDDGAPVVDAILVIDNNSSDRTAALAANAGARVIGEKRQGYGYALQRGLKDADAQIIVLCEPDGTFVAADVVKLLSYAENFDMVCGTRTKRELLFKEANMGWFIRAGNFLVAKFMQVLYGTASLSDCGCTFRLISRTAVDAIFPDLFVGKSHFLPNMIIAARLHGRTFIEIPVTYRGRVGESKITGTLSGTWKTGLAMIWLIVRMWPQYILARGRCPVIS